MCREKVNVEVRNRLRFSGQRGQGWVGKILGTTVGDMQPAFLALVLLGQYLQGPSTRGLFCRRLDSNVDNTNLKHSLFVCLLPRADLF